jgi:hypothetical protein
MLFLWRGKLQNLEIASPPKVPRWFAMTLNWMLWRQLAIDFTISNMDVAGAWGG